MTLVRVKVISAVSKGQDLIGRIQGIDGVNGKEAAEPMTSTYRNQTH